MHNLYRYKFVQTSSSNELRHIGKRMGRGSVAVIAATGSSLKLIESSLIQLPRQFRERESDSALASIILYQSLMTLVMRISALCRATHMHPHITHHPRAYTQQRENWSARGLLNDGSHWWSLEIPRSLERRRKRPCHSLISEGNLM